MYFININITKHACFTWIVVSEFNFTVTFLLIRKTWDDRFAGKVGGILRNGGRVILKWGVDTPLPTM